MKNVLEGSKNVIMTGGTGMIGGKVLELCLKNPKINTITSISRKPLKFEHPKLKQVIHNDFSNFKKIEQHFQNQDVAFYCLGVYTGQVDTEKLREITVDYTKNFSQFCKNNTDEKEFSFNFLSGGGADLTEKSSIPFSKFKGIAENYLLSLNFKNLFIYRPGYIYPGLNSREKEPNISYQIFKSIYPILKSILPSSLINNISITSDDLSQAMFQIGIENDERIKKNILENKDLMEYLLLNKKSTIND